MASVLLVALVEGVLVREYALAIAYPWARYSRSLVPLSCGQRCIWLLYIDSHRHITQTTCSLTREYPPYERGRDEHAPIDLGTRLQEFGATQCADKDGADVWFETFGIHGSSARISWTHRDEDCGNDDQTFWSDQGQGHGWLSSVAN